MEDTDLILSLLCVGLMMLYMKKTADYDHLDGISVRRRWEGERGASVEKRDDGYSVVLP
jgi:hypothetical protein